MFLCCFSKENSLGHGLEKYVMGESATHAAANSNIISVYRFKATLYHCPERAHERREMAQALSSRIDEYEEVCS